MDADRHLAERPEPTAASLAALESRLHRALLEGGELEPMLERILAILERPVRFEWAALVEYDGPTPQITCAWDAGGTGDVVLDRSARVLEVPGIERTAASREDA